MQASQSVMAYPHEPANQRWPACENSLFSKPHAIAEGRPVPTLCCKEASHSPLRLVLARGASPGALCRAEVPPQEASPLGGRSGCTVGPGTWVGPWAPAQSEGWVLPVMVGAAGGGACAPSCTASWEGGGGTCLSPGCVRKSTRPSALSPPNRPEEKGQTRDEAYSIEDRAPRAALPCGAQPYGVLPHPASAAISHGSS